MAASIGLKWPITAGGSFPPCPPLACASTREESSNGLPYCPRLFYKQGTKFPYYVRHPPRHTERFVEVFIRGFSLLYNSLFL